VIPRFELQPGEWVSHIILPMTPNESSSPAAAPNAVNGGQTQKEIKCKNPKVN
jgi:hypothetical protein